MFVLSPVQTVWRSHSVCCLALHKVLGTLTRLQDFTNKYITLHSSLFTYHSSSDSDLSRLGYSRSLVIRKSSRCFSRNKVVVLDHFNSTRWTEALKDRVDLCYRTHSCQLHQMTSCFLSYNTIDVFLFSDLFLISEGKYQGRLSRNKVRRRHNT